MTGMIDIGPLLPLTAFKPSWSVFTPQGPDLGNGAPSLESRAEWLTRFLTFWSAHVDRSMAAPPEAVGTETLRLLLESLANAADVLLAFRRADHPVEIPVPFARTAQRLFARAVESGIQAGGLTAVQIARRLSAAGSFSSSATRPVQVDEQGRVFDLSGEGLFQFAPEDVLDGREAARNGAAHSLQEFREAEGRNGR